MGRHSFHIVDESPWPFTAAIGALGLTSGFVMYFQKTQLGIETMTLGLILVLLTMYYWWKDVIRESTYLGKHSLVVQQGLKYGAILFIVSEVFLFFSIFWGFFHSSLAPTIELGSQWPPVGIKVLDAWSVPLLNTAILLTSGATATWAHHSLLCKNRKDTINGLVWTIGLGIIFTGLQGMEYWEAPFTITDSVYGTTFFVATGLHGIHVIIGTLFILACLVRYIKHEIWDRHHFGLTFSLYYWHMVDVVWLFLFFVIYAWGS